VAVEPAPVPEPVVPAPEPEPELVVPVPEPEPAPVVPAPEPEPEPEPAPEPKRIFAEDFERAAPGSLPAGFTVARTEGTWAVRDLGGEKVLEASGKYTTVLFGSADWTDYELRLRMRFEKAPRFIGAIVRHDPKTGRNYQLEVLPSGVRLVRSFEAGRDEISVGNSEVRPAAGRWHQLRVVCSGRNVEFWVDGERAIRSSENTAPRGQCKLYLRDGAAVFDDIEVLELRPQGQ
jgi:hypothetical protein